MKTKIVESWRQADGGVRYLVWTPYGEITIDLVRGKLTGFTRPNYVGDEDAGLRAAFRAVRMRTIFRGRD